MYTDHIRPIAFREAPESAGKTLLLATCFWCEAPHPARHPLSVCPTCAASPGTGRFPMTSLGMNGPYPLTAEAIDEQVTRRAPGNYALGYLDGETFMVFYVGRSDSDVRRSLRAWVGAAASSDPHARSGRAAWAAQARGPLSLDVAARGIGAHEESSYTRFAYSYAPSAAAAFAKEWRNYEDFGGSDGLDNATTPVERMVA